MGVESVRMQQADFKPGDFCGMDADETVTPSVVSVDTVDTNRADVKRHGGQQGTHVTESSCESCSWVCKAKPPLCVTVTATVEMARAAMRLADHWIAQICSQAHADVHPMKAQCIKAPERKQDRCICCSDAIIAL